jgi:hypothetical protein
MYISMIFVVYLPHIDEYWENFFWAVKSVMPPPFAWCKLPNTLNVALAELSGDFMEVNLWIRD